MPEGSVETSARRRNPLRARRGGGDAQRAYRLASSIRLPWGVGLASLLVLALISALLVGRGEDQPTQVPRGLLDVQQQLAADAAQDVRRSVNEGVADVAGFGRVLRTTGAASATGGIRLQQPPAAFRASHPRYLSVSLLDRRGDTLAHSGDPALPDAPSPAQRALPEPIVTPARPGPDGTPVMYQLAPASARGTVRGVVARYDPAFLRFPLEGVQPGAAWLVDRSGRVVGSLGETARMTPLPRPPLQRAARAAAAGRTGAFSAGGSSDTQDVIAYAPVSGIGPADELGWSVVTSRSVSTLVLPEVEARNEAFLIGVVLALLTLVIFGWLYIVILRPIARLQREAERLAFGDLSKSVEVVRYDEIGLIARSLERVRVLLIRRRVQGERPARRDPKQ